MEENKSINKEGLFFSTSHQQATPCRLLGGVASLHAVAASEDKCLQKKCPSPPSFLSALLAEPFLVNSNPARANPPGFVL